MGVRLPTIFQTSVLANRKEAQAFIVRIAARDVTDQQEIDAYGRLGVIAAYLTEKDDTQYLQGYSRTSEMVRGFDPVAAAQMGAAVASACRLTHCVDTVLQTRGLLKLAAGAAREPEMLVKLSEPDIHALHEICFQCAMDGSDAHPADNEFFVNIIEDLVEARKFARPEFEAGVRRAAVVGENPLRARILKAYDRADDQRHIDAMYEERRKTGLHGP